MSSYSTEIQTLFDSLKIPDSPECPICGRDTNGLLITHHTFWKYGMVPEVLNGLIKCIKCTYAMCDNCWNRFGGLANCPAKCGATLDFNFARKTYGLDRSLEYSPFGTEIWLGQDILNDQKNQNIPRPPGAKGEMKIIKPYLNIENMTLNTLLDIPVLGEPFTIEIAIKLTKVNDPILPMLNPNIIRNKLEDQFKKQIETTFEQFNIPVNEIQKGCFWQTLMEYTQLDKNNLPDSSKSLFELGYVEYIRKVLEQTINIRATALAFPDKLKFIDYNPNLCHYTKFGKPFKTIYRICITNCPVKKTENVFCTLEESRAFFNNQVTASM